jgi:hypothetical protein
MFWSISYKNDYFIQGSLVNGKETIVLLYSPSGYGYEWRQECKSLHAAKILASKHKKVTKQA